MVIMISATNWLLHSLKFSSDGSKHRSRLAWHTVFELSVCLGFSRLQEKYVINYQGHFQQCYSDTGACWVCLHMSPRLIEGPYVFMQCFEEYKQDFILLSIVLFSSSSNFATFKITFQCVLRLQLFLQYKPAFSCLINQNFFISHIIWWKCRSLYRSR